MSTCVNPTPSSNVRLIVMPTLPTSDKSESALRYSRLRSRYDAAFREWIAQTHRPEESIAVPDHEPRRAIESATSTFRYHRDKLAAFLLQSRHAIPPAESQVREAAYFLWLNAGCPVETAMSDWIAAQRLLSTLSPPGREQLERRTHRALMTSASS